MDTHWSHVRSRYHSRNEEMVSLESFPCVPCITCVPVPDCARERGYNECSHTARRRLPVFGTKPHYRNEYAHAQSGPGTHGTHGTHGRLKLSIEEKLNVLVSHPIKVRGHLTLSHGQGKTPLCQPGGRRSNAALNAGATLRFFVGPTWMSLSSVPALELCECWRARWPARLRRAPVRRAALPPRRSRSGAGSS